VQFVSEQKSIPADLASPKDETKSLDFTVNPNLYKGTGTKEDPIEID
jgi:hypothetical protein